MTEQELKTEILNKKNTIDWLKSFLGMPENIVPMGICKNCHKGIIFGQQGVGNEMYHLRTAHGGINNKCGDCMIEDEKQNEMVMIAEQSQVLKRYMLELKDRGLPWGTNLKAIRQKEQSQNKKAKGEF